MAFKLAEAFVELSARGFGGVAATLDKTTNHFNMMGNSITSVYGLVPKLGAALGALGAGVSVAGMVALSVQAEQTAISFEVMLGSADRAKLMITQLEQMGAETPFEFTGLSTAAKTLLSFSVAANDVLPSVSRLSDIAAGSDQKLQSLALVFGQVASAGRLTGQDLLQFVNTGFNPLNEIAKRTGESMSDLRDRMSDGRVSFAEVQQAVIDATSAGGQFYQMNIRQSQTLGGMWSAMKDEVGRSLRAIGDGIVQAFDLKAATANLTSFAKTFQSDILPWFVAGIEHATNFTGALADWGSVLQGVVPIIGAVAAAYAAINVATGIYLLKQKSMIVGEAILAALRGNWVGLAAAAAVGIAAYVGISYQLNKTVNDVQASSAAAKEDLSGLSKELRNAADANQQYAVTSRALATLEQQRQAGGMGEMEYAKRRQRILEASKAATEERRQQASMLASNTSGPAADAGSGASSQTDEAAKKLEKEREDLEREAEQFKQSSRGTGQQLQDSLDRISQMWQTGLLTFEQSTAARQEVRRRIIGEIIPTTEIQKYRDRVAELKDLLDRNLIGDGEFAQGEQAARKSVVDGLLPRSDVAVFHERIEQLKQAFQAGLISKEQLMQGAKDALPSQVKTILEEIKTPIERYQESLAQLEQFRDQKLLNDEQFQKAQKKLNEKFEENNRKNVSIVGLADRWQQLQTSVSGTRKSFSEELAKVGKDQQKNGAGTSGAGTTPGGAIRGAGAGATAKFNAQDPYVKVATLLGQLLEREASSGGIRVSNARPHSNFAYAG